MADSLFDNRYRYDYIYPRGRSGETLRAVDTASQDRPVVIKRPAPNDAPPIRAGQEVSILNERKALQRLSGHPVLTEALGSGQFSVGGTLHQYIVMERAQGVIIADEVGELARRGERLPILEMLIIIDLLLDLLELAHSRDIVYNDVDAKHLFWDRDNYRLKVIDWGNAVFLEGDEITPQGVSRQSDIFQVGELLYFIVTGGSRADIPRDAGEDFLLDFGPDAGHVSPRLRAIISRAAHPNARLRYRTLADLRRDLEAYRKPLESDRTTIVTHVLDRLRRSLSKNDLRGLLTSLEPALAADPGFPLARRAHRDITDRLRDLDVSADLDAVRIYMESGNWSRAADLLNELRAKSGSQTSGMVDLLLDCSVLLQEYDIRPVPPAIMDAVVMIFEGHFVHAANTLLTRDTPSDDVRKLQWLLAERISSRIPEVLLLRPNLYRLDLALSNIADDGVNISDARAVLAEISAMLDALPQQASTYLTRLRDGYRALVDQLSKLNKLLSTAVIQHDLAHDLMPLTPLDRAINAAMALADNMHVIGKQAATSPRDAMVALDSSRAIDPTNPLWDELEDMLANLYERLQTYQTYVPVADGSDLEGWLNGVRRALVPYRERLFDDMLIGMVRGLETAHHAWADYAVCIVHGDRAGAVARLKEAAQSVTILSPTLSGWLAQLENVIENALYIERHAIYGGLGRALADGWEAFDRGRLPDAERLGQQAIEIARTESERSACHRLVELAGTVRDWIERNGIIDRTRTQAAHHIVDNLYTPQQKSQRDHFSAQMPTRETYLRAMNRGLVAVLGGSSTAAVRLFYIDSVLRGALHAHDGELDDAAFWREVAARCLGDHGPRHVCTRTLDEFIERRRDLLEAAELIDSVCGSRSLGALHDVRRRLEENPQARLLTAAGHSLRELEAALHEWTDGEFRAAGLKLENAIQAAADVEHVTGITIPAYRGWLAELQGVAAELHTINRQMRQTVERLPAEPQDSVHETLLRQVKTTRALLGESYAAQMKQWLETYEAFLEVYTDDQLRRTGKLARFNELFKAMFIDRHPTYALYRHWYDLVDSSPEFPAPPTDDPTPRIHEEEAVAEVDFTGQANDYQADDTQPVEAVGGGRRSRWTWLLLVLLLVLIAGTAALVITNLDADDNNDGGAPVQAQDTDVPAIVDTTSAPDSDADETEIDTEAVLASTVTAQAVAELVANIDATNTAAAVPPTQSDSASVIASQPTNTQPPTSTPAPTEPPATATATATETDVPPTETATASPTATLPPQGLQGWQDLLALAGDIEAAGEQPWSDEQFARMGDSGVWRLGMGRASEADSGDIVITLPPDLLDTYYGNDAPARLRRSEATISLTTYDPALIDQQQVYFGLVLQSASDSAARAGVHIQVASLNAINLCLVEGAALDCVSQRSVSQISPRLRLERDASSGAVTVFFNDAQVGDPIPFVSLETPVQPVLFVRRGGVIVSVVNWRVGLR